MEQAESARYPVFYFLKAAQSTDISQTHTHTMSISRWYKWKIKYAWNRSNYFTGKKNSTYSTSMMPILIAINQSHFLFNMTWILRSFAHFIFSLILSFLLWRSLIFKFKSHGEALETKLFFWSNHYQTAQNRSSLSKSMPIRRTRRKKRKTRKKSTPLRAVNLEREDNKIIGNDK